MIAGQFRLGLCSRSTWHFPAICPKLGYRSLSCTIDVFGVLTETNQTADWFNHRPCWMWCFFIGFWRLCFQMLSVRLFQTTHRCWHGVRCRRIPQLLFSRGFSFGSLYIFAQALGLVWMFLVVLLAVMSVRIVLLGICLLIPHENLSPLCIPWVLVKLRSFKSWGESFVSFFFSLWISQATYEWWPHWEIAHAATFELFFVSLLILVPQPRSAAVDSPDGTLPGYPWWVWVRGEKHGKSPAV